MSGRARASTRVRRRWAYQAVSAPLRPAPPPPAPDLADLATQIPPARRALVVAARPVATTVVPPALVTPFDVRLFPRGAWPEVPPIVETVFGYQALAGPIKPAVDVLDQGLRFSLFPGLPLPAPRRRLRIEGGRVGPWRLADLTAVVPALAWQGSAPSWIARRRGPAVGQTIQSLIAALPFLDPTRFDWRGSAPAWVARRRLIEAARPVVVGLSPTPWPIPDLSWQGWWPAQVWAAPRVRANGTVAWEPADRPNAPSPDLAWAGEASTWIARPGRVIDRGGLVRAARVLPTGWDAIDSLATPPAWIARRTTPPASQPRGTDRFAVDIPDLRRDWAGAYPDRVPRVVTRLPGGGSVPAEHNRAISPLDWYAEDQDPPLPRSRQMALPQIAAPDPALLEGPATQLAWQAAAAWPIVRPWGTAGLRTGPLGVWTPITSAGAVLCLELVPVALQRPRLVGTTLTRSTLRAITLRSPGLSGEVC